MGHALAAVKNTRNKRGADDCRTTDPKTIVLKIEGDKYEVSVGGRLDRGTCMLDAAAQPKAMKLTGTYGLNQGKTFLCIYEISGETLRVCYDLSGKQTPTEFATAAGTPLYLVTYARKKE
jgi:uncharacterized protein (TIGR03067 family)